MVAGALQTALHPACCPHARPRDHQHKSGNSHPDIYVSFETKTALLKDYLLMMSSDKNNINLIQ